MATTNELNRTVEELPLTTTGEPTDQLTPEENEDDLDTEDAEANDDLIENDDEDPDDDIDVEELDTDNSDFDKASMEDDDEDLDDDEVKRLFPSEDSYTEDEGDEEEPYEGIRHGDEEEEGLVDDNMSGMPVIPSPS